MEVLKREKFKIDISALNVAKFIHKNDYINMGMLSEDNIFLEAENDPKTDEAKSDQNPQQAKPKPDSPTSETNKSTDKTQSKTPDTNDVDPFGGAEMTDTEDSVLTEGLPKDDQYYVILLKHVNKKITKLTEISLKLLNQNDEMDNKIVNKINVLKYVFNRFIEQYDEYENPKIIILKLQTLVDTMVIHVNKYIKKFEK